MQAIGCYRVQSPLLTGIRPASPVLTDMPTQLEAGDCQLTAESKWVETDVEDDDDTPPPQPALTEDTDPVPLYLAQEAPLHP